MVKDSTLRAVGSPGAAALLPSPSSTGIGTGYTLRPRRRELALVALFGMLCHTRHVPFSLIQEDSKWQQAFLGSKFARALEDRWGLDGSDCCWWALGWC